MVQFRIVRKFKLSKQVKSQQGKDHDPDGKVYFPAQDSEVIGLVYGTQELHPEGEYDKTEDHFDRIQPAAGLRKSFQPGREDHHRREQLSR